MDAICVRLKSERLRLGLTQEEMAKVGGVARNAQVYYEKGDRHPDTQYLALVHAVGVDVSYVVTGARIAPAIETLSPRETNLVNNFKIIGEEEKRVIEHLVSVLPKVEN